MAGLELIDTGAPAVVTLDAIKLHLRVDDDTEDPLITGLIAGAGLLAEHYTRRTLLSRRCRLWLDRWPPGRRAIELPATPLIAISEVTLIDEEGGESLLDPQDWRADQIADPGRLLLRAGVSAPSGQRPVNGLAIGFTAGYGDQLDQIPAPIRHGVALLVGHLYESREAGALASLAAVPWGVEALWAPYRRLRL